MTDTQTLIVDIDAATAGFDFGAGPTKVATMGFGQGFLYNSTLGQGIADHIDSLSGEQWLFEYADGTISSRDVA